MTIDSKVKVMYAKIYLTACQTRSFSVFTKTVHIRHNDCIWFANDNERLFDREYSYLAQLLFIVYK